MKAYQILNDAAQHEPGLQAGPVRILFWNNLCMFKFMKGEMPRLSDLERTHIKLGSIACTDLDEIFRILQGDNWNPQKEGTNLLKRLNTHPSMTMGDIIVINNEYWAVVRTGFQRLEKETESQEEPQEEIIEEPDIPNELPDMLQMLLNDIGIIRHAKESSTSEFIVSDAEGTHWKITVSKVEQ